MNSNLTAPILQEEHTLGTETSNLRQTPLIVVYKGCEPEFRKLIHNPNADLTKDKGEVKNRWKAKLKGKASHTFCWQYFKIYDNQVLYSGFCVCMICGLELSICKSSTTDLNRHLKNKHDLESVKEEKEKRDGTVQTMLENVVAKKDYTKHYLSVVEFIIQTNQPLSVVSNDSFKKMLSTFDGKVDIKQSRVEFIIKKLADAVENDGDLPGSTNKEFGILT